MHPKISIIIPCYNVESIIEDMLSSLTYYSGEEVEYLIVNDGSTDNTGFLIEKFCEKQSNCRYINKENGGVSSARNQALDIVRGEYVYLLDGDDFLMKDSVKIMLKSIQKTPPDMLISSFYYVSGIERTLAKLPLSAGDYDIRQLLNSIYIFPIAQKNLYKTEIIKKNNLRFNSSLKLGEVFDFTLRFLNYSERIRLIDDALFNYVMRDESAIHSINYKRDLTIIDTLESYIKHGVRFIAYSSYWVTIYHLFTSFSYSKYLKNGCKDNVTYKIINTLLSNKYVLQILKRVMLSSKVSLKDRISSIYLFTTRSLGYKILNNIFLYKSNFKRYKV